MMTVNTLIYEPFTIDSAISYSKQIGIFEQDDTLVAQEIGDGNLNLVFRIQNQQTNKSIILKQALPYAKVVGSSWPLTLDRARIESEALKRAYELVPEFTPRVYHSDQTLAVTVMDDLSHLQILRKGFIAGQVYPRLARDIGIYLAHTLFYHSDFGMNQQEKKKLTASFINPELCKITEDLVFTDPFFDHDTNNIPAGLKEFVKTTLWDDNTLKREVATLKHIFLTKGETLLHGDLHSGSIFASPVETVVIDPEFAYFGPMGFDIGAFIANILLNYLSQEAHMDDEQARKEYQNYLLSVMIETWNVFVVEFGALWQDHSQDAFMKVDGFLDDVLQRIFADTLGFAGCKMIRRMIGLSGVEDVESIEDIELRLKVKRAAITLGKTLILNRSTLSSMNELKKVVTQ
ncbi:S-methyl-5-thioribose kinase [Bacillus sp. JCM 19034]|uniref:S-methyl-5-thioribose kinase n=1 Tax=Bacillus sp. JCM 19034 TaxID=1481928 RepID=UPI00078022D5|nr:S-methyl-5-thioribose kinase [Bacillus sp. JCM 19034]